MMRRNVLGNSCGIAYGVLLLCGLVGAFVAPGCSSPDVDGDGDDDVSTNGVSTNGVTTNGAADGAGDPDGNDDSAPEEDPFADIVLDANVYHLPADPDRMVEAPAGTHGSIRVAADQVLLWMYEGTAREEVARIATDLGGSIVGHIPSLDLYQVGLPTTALAELDAALADAQSRPDVYAALYNPQAESHADCPAENDNEQLVDDARCPFAETEYYQAITMFDAFRPYVTTHRVTVAVIDSGADATHSQLSTRNIFNLNDPDQPSTDSDPTRHGTKVMGIIAAVDDGFGVNGLASRFLYEHLLLMAGEARDFFGTLVMTKQAALAGADIINLSGGFRLAVWAWPEYRDLWIDLISEHDDVLLVTSAPNDQTELTTENDAPAGIGLANIITVGGTADCNPDIAALHSDTGPLIDIAAPAEYMPTISADGDLSFETVHGNSFAAPQVTSLAAILKALDPSLTPVEIKEDYIRGTAYTTSSLVGGRRLAFAPAIEQLLLDIGVGEPVEDWIDPRAEGVGDPAGLVLGRLCTGISYRVEGFGTFESTGDDDVAPVGSMAADGFYILATIDDASLGISAWDSFSLGTYMLCEDPEAPWCAVADFIQGASLGRGISGTWTLEGCRIDERHPLNQDPTVVSVWGTFGGTMYFGPAGDPPVQEFEGTFNLPFLILQTGTGDPMFDYLEDNCEGGIPRE